MNKRDVLRDRDLLVPVFRALQHLGGAGTNQAIFNQVVAALQLPEEMLAVPHTVGQRRSELAYRMAWACTYLQKCGIIKNIGRALWAIEPAYAQVVYIDQDIIMNLAHGSGSVANPSQQAERPWTRNETILALALYYQLTPTLWTPDNPAVLSLGRKIARPGMDIVRKLQALRAVEKGQTDKSKGTTTLDDTVWDEFSSAHWRLAQDADQLLHAGTNRTAEVAVRVGQAFFRNAVLGNYGNRCCMTGISVPTLLVASHIKPWAQSDDATEKANPQNGLCLNALHDKAFDQGLITVDDQYRIVVSTQLKQYPKLDETTKNWLCKDEGKEIYLPERGKPGRIFLEYHQDTIFLH